MPKDSHFDPTRTYDEKTYTITGGALNDIGQTILKLKKQAADTEKDAIQLELADLRLRDKNPAVKDAWDKYRTVLELTRKT